MKIINVFIILFIFLFCSCAPKNELKPKVTKDIKVFYDEDRDLHEQYYVPVDTVKPGWGIRLSFDQKSFKTKGIKSPLTFIIPRAKELFKKNENYDAYPKRKINGITYMFVHVSPGAEIRSEILTIEEHTSLKPGEKVRYPFAVYLKDVRELGDGDSSPAIIVEP